MFVYGADIATNIPDPPYVYGDHAAVCRGCDECLRLEAEWLAEQAKR